MSYIFFNSSPAPELVTMSFPSAALRDSDAPESAREALPRPGLQPVLASLSAPTPSTDECEAPARTGLQPVIASLS